MIRIFIEKLSSAMRLISCWMASSINKICVIGQTAIYTYSMSQHCITKKLRLLRFMGRRRHFAGCVIGPYFLRDDQYRHVTVNGNRNRSMITEYFWPKLYDMEMEDIWFQQDGATSHTANVIINLLETKFGERVISWNDPVGWPPRSCYLTPLDYFL